MMAGAGRLTHNPGEDGGHPVRRLKLFFSFLATPINGGAHRSSLFPPAMSEREARWTVIWANTVLSSGWARRSQTIAPSNGGLIAGLKPLS